jgi:hypothetical protein
VAIDRYGMFIIIILLVLLSYSGLGNLIARGELALWRLMLPAFQ